MSKICSYCGETKRVQDFYKRASQCKSCIGKISRANRIGSYGITEEYFRFLLEKQDNRCGICQQTFVDESKITIDHDHTCCDSIPIVVKGKKRSGNIRKNACGKCVRGLLCTSCNVGLGMLQDDPNRLLSALLYLREYIPDDKFSEETSLEFTSLIIDLNI